MSEALDAALAARRAARNPNRCNPDTEFKLGWAAALEAAPMSSAEYGVRHDSAGSVVQGGPGWQHLVKAGAKAYPGYTLVTRPVGEWEPLTPNTSTNKDTEGVADD